MLTYIQTNDAEITSPEGKLLKGKKITGEFTAKDNYLGIVFLRFNRFVKPDFSGEDVLVFRIKEKSEHEWRSLNSYRSGLLERQLLFPFGFSVDPTSKGKTYQFEIESLYGNPRNAIEVEPGSTGIITGYQYPKNEILSSKKNLISFFIKKIHSSFTDIDFILSSALYLIPLLVYFMWKFILNRSPKVNKLFVISLIGLTLGDILIIKEMYIGILIEMMMLWIISVIICRFESRILFGFSIFFLFVWVILILFQSSDYSKVNFWVYFLFLLGVIQSIIETKFNIKKQIGYEDFLPWLSKINEKI